ncbi:MAG: GNAT family N-acetyltransferase [Chloroflexi bacterium]|nr:GNAT family N-acetyltransferase [Chloroflexota bacterium]
MATSEARRREHKSVAGEIVRGRKVILREKRTSDGRNDYAWRLDQELARLDATVPIRLSLDEFATLYQDELRHPSPRRRRFAIDTLVGKHIGNCMYYEIDQRRKQAELGIMIGDKRYWSHGYGADAVESLLCHIFETTDLRRIYLYTLDWNIRAQKCFRKCGFKERQRVARDGHSFVLMDITREEWERRTDCSEEAPSLEGEPA